MWFSEQLCRPLQSNQCRLPQIVPNFLRQSVNTSFLSRLNPNCWVYMCIIMVWIAPEFRWMHNYACIGPLCVQCSFQARFNNIKSTTFFILQTEQAFDHRRFLGTNYQFYALKRIVANYNQYLLSTIAYCCCSKCSIMNWPRLLTS